jgi:hypothetical protein
MNKETYKSENRIQQECVIHFHNTYPELRGLLFAVPNGGARSITEGLLLKKTGVVPGVSDMIFLYKGAAYLFELKTEKGTQSEKQINWQKLVQKQGFKYFIIRSEIEFAAIVKLIIV